MEKDNELRCESYFFSYHAPKSSMHRLIKSTNMQGCKQMYLCLYRHGYVRNDDLDFALSDIKGRLADLRTDGVE